MNEDAKGTPQPNPTRCRRCGICMGACPERIISFKDYSVDIVSSMIKAVNVPDEFEEKPRLAGPALRKRRLSGAGPGRAAAASSTARSSASSRSAAWGRSTSCGSPTRWPRGFDGILLVGCKSGDDYQCHFIRGSELMGTRSDNIREKLNAAGPGGGARPRRAAFHLGVPQAAGDHQRVCRSRSKKSE